MRSRFADSAASGAQIAQIEGWLYYRAWSEQRRRNEYNKISARTNTLPFVV